MKRIRHQYGRVYRPDRRDARYLLAAKKSARTSRYWNGGQILHQGDTPSCVGHAWVGHLLLRTKRIVLPFGLYELCQYRDEWEGESYDGTSVRAGADVLKMQGLVSEYRWARKLDALIYAVLELGPVVMGTDWYAGMEAGGIMETTGELLGGHAYLIDGANTKKELARVRNSWGTGWGDDGRAWLPFDDLKKLLKDQGEACIATPSDPLKLLRAA